MSLQELWAWGSLMCLHRCAFSYVRLLVVLSPPPSSQPLPPPTLPQPNTHRECNFSCEERRVFDWQRQQPQGDSLCSGRACLPPGCRASENPHRLPNVNQPPLLYKGEIYYSRAERLSSLVGTSDNKTCKKLDGGSPVSALWDGFSSTADKPDFSSDTLLIHLEKLHSKAFF